LTCRLFLTALLAGCAGPAWQQTATGKAHDITFTYEDAQARTVELAGSFNNWKPDSNPLRKTDMGKWSTTLNLQPGAHQYMFVIDGKKWLSDPSAAHTLPDGFGQVNSMVIVE
jgi:1,4-alpha-glucan branching enzyme